MNVRQLVQCNDRVFPSHPQVGRYFPAAAMEAARRRLVRSIERGDGPCVVIGSAGTGKSLLLQVLAAGFKERFDVVLLACTSLCTRRALLQAIHFELGLEYRRRDEGQLRLSLLDQLLAAGQSVEGLLLLVDEAQALPTHLIEELRMLTNLVRGGAPRVRLVLAGLPSLEEKLAGPELESFSQRLAARCYLGKLTRQETTQYVRAHFAASSVDPDQLVAADAWPALFDATDGVPRLVNQLCEQALVLAAERDVPQIDRALVQAAWAELQQLPMPWEMTTEGASSETSEAGVIEFGSLDADEPPAEILAQHAVAEPPVPVTTAQTTVCESVALANDDFEVVDPTELDEEVDGAIVAAAPCPPVPAAATAVASSPLRPKVFEGCVAEAVDPFTGEFEEEELVLESFGALSTVFHPQTPQVENRRNPAFAQLLDQAIRTATATETHPDDSQSEARRSRRHGREPGQSSIRLAVVAESTLHDSETFSPQPASETDADVDPDEQPTQFDDVIISRRPSPRPAVGHVPGPAPAVATAYPPGPSSMLGAVAVNVERHRDDIDAVLVIEDEPADVDRASSGVRREEYRHLFSRLRHGT